MKSSKARGLLAMLLIATIQASAQPAEPRPENPAPPRLSTVALTLPVRWEAPQRPLYNQAPNSSLKPVRKRNKALIALGAACVAGGVALMAVGPTSTSQSPYTETRNLKVSGAGLAGLGAFALVFGLKGK